MDKTLEDIDNRLSKLEEAIAETRKRLPAHSVKPPVMMELLQLEDERDELLERRAQIQNRLRLQPEIKTNRMNRR